MPVAVKLWDVTHPGQRTGAGEIALDGSRTSARKLIEARVRQEVERVNSSQTAEAARVLVEVSEAERLLNGERRKREIDPAVQIARAIKAFQSNGFMLFVDGNQLTDLDGLFDLAAEPEVEFIKLVPLVGGSSHV
jgi:hypothetical protein